MLIERLDEIPDCLKTGCRAVFLIERSKEKTPGELTRGERWAHKIITTSIDEWEAAVDEFHRLQKNNFPSYRIYTSVNERSMDKGIREFKQRQLDNDYNPVDVRNDFYQNIKNRFFSCLMNPKSKNQSLFLIDCDSSLDYELAMKELEVRKILGANILYEYETKNGRHIITGPFPPDNFPVTIHKDGLLYIG